MPLSAPAPTPVSAADHAAPGHAHGGHSHSAPDRTGTLPGVSLLRLSLAGRLALVGCLVALLWTVVLLVTGGGA